MWSTQSPQLPDDIKPNYKLLSCEELLYCKEKVSTHLVPQWKSQWPAVTNRMLKNAVTHRPSCVHRLPSYKLLQQHRLLNLRLQNQTCESVKLSERAASRCSLTALNFSSLLCLPSRDGSLCPIWVRKKNQAADLTRGQRKRMHAVMWPDGWPCLGSAVSVCVWELVTRQSSVTLFLAAQQQLWLWQGLAFDSQWTFFFFSFFVFHAVTYSVEVGRGEDAPWSKRHQI